MEHINKLEEAAIKAAAEAAASSSSKQPAAAVEQPVEEVPQHIKDLFDQEMTDEKNAEANNNKPQWSSEPVLLRQANKNTKNFAESGRVCSEMPVSWSFIQLISALDRWKKYLQFS